MNIIRDPWMRQNILYPIAGELAWRGFKRARQFAADYKATAAPLILSQKINNMPPVKKRKQVLNKVSKKDMKKLGLKGKRTMPGRASRSSRKGGGSGFIKGLRKMTGVRKYTRRNKVAKLASKGFNLTFEVSKSGSNVDNVIVGHSTFAPLTIYRTAIATMIKKMLDSRGVDSLTVNDGIEGFTVGSKFSVIYRPSIDSGTTFADFVATSGLTSINDLVTWWVDPARPWASSKEIIFEYLLILGCRFQCQGMKFKFAVQSNLKVQNRSINGGTDESIEQVDNVPIIGKSYLAKGTDLAPKKGYLSNNFPFQLAADRDYAYIERYGNTDNAYVEPPQPSAFSNCKAVGGLEIAPGQILLSSMRDFFSFSLNYLHYYCTNLLQPPTQPQPVYNPRMVPIGKVKVLFMEKALTSLSTATIAVAWEHNYELSCTATYRYKPTLLKVFTKVV